MKIIRPGDDAPISFKKSIFLAGPTPRDDKTKSWRTAALKELKEQGYNGVVFVPEGDFSKRDYLDQVEWENKYLNMADCILFWVPRSIGLPAFTTNVEYGEWMKSGKCVLGFPESAEKMRYLETKAKEYFVPGTNELKSTVEEAMKMVGDGALRRDGERYVPICIWNNQSFKAWYGALKKAGNRLDKATVLWAFRVGPEKKAIFSWVLHVDVYVSKEKRHKTNEFVFSRTDISTVMAYYPGNSVAATKILLVKEFRSPCSNSEGFVYELPGGSSKDASESITNTVVNELEEEVGLKLPKSRFKYQQSRQLAATLSAHKSHLFSVELTEKECKNLQRNVGKTKGVSSDSEKTYTELLTLKEIIEKDLLDWSMLGMIFKVLSGKKPVKNEEEKDWVGQFIK